MYSARSNHLCARPKTRGLKWVGSQQDWSGVSFGGNLVKGFPWIDKRLSPRHRITSHLFITRSICVVIWLDDIWGDLNITQSFNFRNVWKCTNQDAELHFPLNDNHLSIICVGLNEKRILSIYSEICLNHHTQSNFRQTLHKGVGTLCDVLVGFKAFNKKAFNTSEILLLGTNMTESTACWAYGGKILARVSGTVILRRLRY